MSSIDKYTKAFGTISVAAVLAIVTGCGGGGGDDPTSSAGASPTDTTTTTTTDTTTTTNTDGEVLSAQTTGIDVPSQISAVPAQNASTEASFLGALMQFRANASAANELGEGTDYVKEKSNVFVEERALDQFDIIEQVFGALAQTKYADEDNVNAGPYVAMVTWEENQNGKSIKQLQRWTVESRMITVDELPSDVTGNTSGDVNKLLAWIPEVDRSTGQEQLVKAEFLIYTAPTTAADGSLLNYGEWDMNVLMEASSTGVDTIPADGPASYFAASARIADDGSSTLKVHDRFTEDFGEMNFSGELRGILVRDGDNGYGSILYPDWDTCFNAGGDGGGEGDGTMVDGGGADGAMEMGPMMNNTCANGIPTNEANYAYTADYLVIQQVLNNETGETVYKDRSRDNAVRIVHDYQLYYADDSEDGSINEGDNIRRHNSFGFPVTFTATAEQDESVSFEAFAFYGSWMGRHQLWGPGNSITATTDGSDGTTLTRADVPPDQTAPTYKLKEFSGTFTKRAMVNASLDDIEGVAAETWLDEHFKLFYMSDPNGDQDTSDAGWYYCEGDLDRSSTATNTENPEMGTRPNCVDKTTREAIAFTNLAGSDLVNQLSVGESDRRWVSIDSSNEMGGQQYVYLTSSDNESVSSPGFYEAEWGQNGLRATSELNRLAETDGTFVNVSLGGAIYVAYVGFDNPNTTTGWVAKELTGFNRDTWMPTFSEDGDSPFTPKRGKEYYMHANGQNYVVTRTTETITGPESFSAKLELQTAANPRNTNTSSSVSILPNGTDYLAPPWDKNVKLELVEDPSDPNYLLLVVKEDSSGSLSAGSVYTNDSWGLTAFNSSDQPLDVEGAPLTADEWGWINPEDNDNRQPVQFNYEYVGNDGNSWGKQQFLVTPDLSTYIILDDPINLAGVELYDNRGNSTDETVSLQYDGWMHGMPDLYRELERNNWTVNQSIGDKVRRLKPGQVVEDTEGTRYFVKPMEVSLFNRVVAANTIPEGEVPNIALADDVDLSSVPDYTHHEMGAAPTTGSDGAAIQVKYSEGIPLSSSGS